MKVKTHLIVWAGKVNGEELIFLIWHIENRMGMSVCLYNLYILYNLYVCSLLGYVAINSQLVMKVYKWVKDYV